MEMTEGDLHAAELVLKGSRAAAVQAGVVLAGRPGLLHAGWVVQRLGLTGSVPGPLTGVQAVLPTALHRVLSNPDVRDLVHVWYAVVHHGDPQQTIKDDRELKNEEKTKKE